VFVVPLTTILRYNLFAVVAFVVTYNYRTHQQNSTGGVKEASDGRPR
jgi:hypothetical protein